VLGAVILEFCALLAGGTTPRAPRSPLRAEADAG
jgi:hypothetical protein